MNIQNVSILNDVALIAVQSESRILLKILKMLHYSGPILDIKDSNATIVGSELK